MVQHNNRIYVKYIRKELSTVRFTNCTIIAPIAPKEFLTGIRRMVQSAEVFPDEQTVAIATLQLSLLPL